MYGIIIPCVPGHSYRRLGGSKKIIKRKKGKRDDGIFHYGKASTKLVYLNHFLSMILRMTVNGTEYGGFFVWNAL